MLLDKIIMKIKNPKYFLLFLLRLKIFRILNDEIIIKLRYKLLMGKELNLKNPKTFNEKLQWLKLNNRDPKYTQLADKIEVRKYIKEKIGADYLIPLLGVYNSFEEIDFDSLPCQFVLKPNHTSGDIFICKDKTKINHEKLKKTVKKWLNKNYYWIHREWPYKNIKPKILCEKYMVDESGSELKDYKIFCFGGEPLFIQVDFDRFTDHKRNLYDLEWNLLEVEYQYPNDPQKIIKKPLNIDEMLNLARILSKDIPFVRVDFYSIYNKIYFGELTFFPEAGHGKFKPESFDEILGNYLKLP